MRRPAGPTLALVLLVVVSTALRGWAGSRVTGLWIAPDEMIWGALGRSLWEDGDLAIYGSRPAFGLVYPALIGAPLAFLGLDAGLEVVRLLQALVMSLTAVPVYLWGRRLAGPWWALVAAALTLAVPDLVYTGMLLSEVAFYPAAALAAWALAEALERPTRAHQALLVGAVALAAATRLQALVLPLVVVTAALVEAGLAREPRRALRLWPAVTALAAAALVWVAWRAAAAGSLSAALGGYAAAAGAGYGAGDVARATLYHAAALLLAVGVFPVCAVALLLLDRRASVSSPLRAYLAVAVSLTAWLLLQVGAFVSVYVPGGLSTRYLLPLLPVLFVGLAAWLARGAPRGRLRGGLVAVGTLAVLLVLPLRDVVVQEAAWQSTVVIPLLWLREHSSEAALELAVWCVAAAALALLAVVPRRAAVVLPALALVGLAFASVAASREVAQNIAFDRQHLVGGEPRWIDRRARGSVAYVYMGEQPVNIVWHQLFWNERLVEVLAAVTPRGGLPVQTPTQVAPDGQLVPANGPVRQRWLVAVDGVRLRGEPAARVPLQSAGQHGLTLWRVDPPARLSWLLAGIQENGDLYEPARVTAWDCGSGRLELTLLPKLSSRVLLRVNGATVQTLEVAGEPYVNATVHPPEGAQVCRFEIVPDALLGSTRIEFVRG